MMNGEKLVTAILTQAVDDARYTGTRKKYLKHKWKDEPIKDYE